MRAITLRTIFFLIMLVVLTSGCASITRGTTEAYAVQTKPPGAEVNSSSGWQCRTPCSVKVKRRSDFVLTITKPGYETVTATVTSSIDGAGAAGMAGNVILGGIIGAGVDAGTGAMHSHKPNPLIVEMVLLGGSGQSGTPTMPKTTDAAEFVGAESQLRGVTEAGRKDCRFIATLSRGAGGLGNADSNLESAMQKALNDAVKKGADSYFIVDSAAKPDGASVVIEALECRASDGSQQLAQSSVRPMTNADHCQYIDSTGFDVQFSSDIHKYAAKNTAKRGGNAYVIQGNSKSDAPVVGGQTWLAGGANTITIAIYKCP